MTDKARGLLKQKGYSTIGVERQQLLATESHSGSQVQCISDSIKLKAGANGRDCAQCYSIHKPVAITCWCHEEGGGGVVVVRKGTENESHYLCC